MSKLKSRIEEHGPFTIHFTSQKVDGLRKIEVSFHGAHFVTWYTNARLKTIRDRLDAFHQRMDEMPLDHVVTSNYVGAKTTVSDIL